MDVTTVNKDTVITLSADHSVNEFKVGVNY